MPSTHILTLQPTYFTAIASGSKTVEGRLRTAKYASIRPGDTIIFRSNALAEDGSVPELERIVTQISVFTSFHGMLEECGLQACLPGCDSMEKGVRVYKEIYREAPDGEEEFGVVGIGIREP